MVWLCLLARSMAWHTIPLCAHTRYRIPFCFDQPNTPQPKLNIYKSNLCCTCSTLPPSYPLRCTSLQLPATPAAQQPPYPSQKPHSIASLPPSDATVPSAALSQVLIYRRGIQLQADAPIATVPPLPAQSSQPASCAALPPPSTGHSTSLTAVEEPCSEGTTPHALPPPPQWASELAGPPQDPA